MARYFGYSSIGRNKKFRVEDYELIKRDLLNNLLIRRGEVPGKPDVGTEVWNYLYENIESTTLARIKDEIIKTVQIDPRIRVTDIQLLTQQNGLIVELTVSTAVTTTTELLRVFFNTDSNTAAYL